MDRRHLERAVISMPGLVLSGFESRQCKSYRKNREIILDRPEYLMEFIELVNALEKSSLKKEERNRQVPENKVGLQKLLPYFEDRLKKTVHPGLLIAAFNHCGYKVRPSREKNNPIIGVDPSTNFQR